MARRSEPSARRLAHEGQQSSDGSRPGAVRRRAGAMAAVLVVLPGLLATSACGGPAAAGGGDGGDYTVMTWAPSGSGAADRHGVTAVAEAIGRSVDAKGGVGGRKLKVLTCNEQNTVEGATACARQAVDAHAVAVIGSYSQYGDTFMPALESARIPYLGGFGLSSAEFSSPDSYPVAGGTPTLIAGSGRQLAAAGCRSVALIRPDTRAGDTLTRYLSGALQPSGVKLSDVKVAEKATDLTAAAQRAIGDDRTGSCVTNALGPDQTLSLIEAYRRVGPKRTLLASLLGSVQQSVIDATGGADSPLNESYATGWYPPEASRVWDDLRATVQSGSDQRIDISDLGVQNTWVAYQVFFQAADRIRSAGQPLTAKSLRTQLDSGDSLDPGGATPPLNWGMTDMLPSAETPRLVNTWVTFQQVKAGRLTEQQRGFSDIRWALTGGKPPQ
ncbi:ABC transporter substrate-binding protein [Kitasatospora sp. GP82]|uniref:ABC transporter substrate-binding protein n=1 Tax=Kitasatospora sp. GP82 TaxID=3035089 RepID=UPI0024756B12|nr:ABC transporter substrate-binding protein [Kitasatospora sp. GP82]MDH6125582.1 ABC-type branched-subunit amino acid transport system substrate-binding protein [Kitasatospora sp. GP82]